MSTRAAVFKEAVIVEMISFWQGGLDTGVTLLLESSKAGPAASEAIAELAGQVVAQRTTSLEEAYLVLLAAA